MFFCLNVSFVKSQRQLVTSSDCLARGMKKATSVENENAMD